MAIFSGVSHVSLSVTDLDRSQHFYTHVLGFVVLMDWGEVRVLIHPQAAFQISLVRHPERDGKPFTELNTGLDHIGLIAASRDELVEWAEHFDAAGVSYTPIRDMPFGSHLNFRDPDDIPLEFYVPNDLVTQGLEEFRTRGDVSPEEVSARVQEALNAST